MLYQIREKNKIILIQLCIICIISVVLGGCGLDPNHRRELNRRSSDVGLCERRVSQFFEQGEREVDEEIRSRNIDCNAISWRYREGMARQQLAVQQANWIRQNVGNIVDSSVQSIETFIIVGGAVSAARTPVSTSSNLNTPHPSAHSCFLNNQWISGNFRNCSYNCVGGSIVQTISATSICPNPLR